MSIFGKGTNLPKSCLDFATLVTKKQRSRVAEKKSTTPARLPLSDIAGEKRFLGFYIISALFLVNVTILLGSLTFSHLLNLN